MEEKIVKINFTIPLWIMKLSMVLFFCVICSKCDIEMPVPCETKECLSKSTLDMESDSRRKIAEKYLASLTENRDDWINPNDMFNFRGLNYEEESDVPHVANKDAKNYADGDVNNDLDREANNDVDREPNNDVDREPNNDAKRDEVSSEESFIIENISLSKNDVYLSRWLGKFLTKIKGLSIEEGSKLFIQFPLSSRMSSVIQEVLEKKPLDVQQLDDIIGTMISGSVLKTEDLYQQSSSFYSFNFKNYMILSLIVSVTAIILYFAVVKTSKLMLIIIFACANVFWHWMSLYQRKLAEQQYHLDAVDFENECHVKDRGFLKNVYFSVASFFGSDNKCQNYYKAMIVDPIWDVSFSVALSDTLSSFVFQPLKVLSTVCNYCVKELLNDLSISQKIFVAVFAALILLMLFGYSLKLPFWVALQPDNRTSRVQELTGSSFQPLTSSSNTKEESVPEQTKSNKIFISSNKTVVNMICQDDQQKATKIFRKALSVKGLDRSDTIFRARSKSLENISLSSSESDTIEDLTAHMSILKSN